VASSNRVSSPAEGVAARAMVVRLPGRLAAVVASAGVVAAGGVGLERPRRAPAITRRAMAAGMVGAAGLGANSAGGFA
jgi:hypothetical protein